jgi:CheY-like chemotaxis protein
MDPLSLLIVDDNEDSREAYAEYLRLSGVTVSCSSSAVEGLTTATSSPPDLIVMDLHMPGMDGWDATKRLKAGPETRAIPVLVLSADAFPEARRRAAEAGADAYCIKPIDPQQLLGEIRRTIAAVRPKQA